MNPSFDYTQLRGVGIMDDSDKVLRLLGLRVKEIRKAQSLSQEKLGEKAGFHFSYIGGLERGEKNISLKNLAKISSALGIKLADLLRYEEAFDNYVNLDKERELTEIFELLLSQESPELLKIKKILKEMLS